MSKDKKTDKAIVYYVVGGAVVGAIAGYIIKKVGFQNILNVLKSKNILPENIADTISEFASRGMSEELEDDDL